MSKIKDNEFKPDYGNDPKVLNDTISDMLKATSTLQTKLTASEKLIADNNIVLKSANNDVARLSSYVDELVKDIDRLKKVLEKIKQHEADRFKISSGYDAYVAILAGEALEAIKGLERK